MRTHATVLAGDVDAVLAHLRGANVRYRVTPASADFDFPRVWLGVTAGDPCGYQPATDAGLWLEVVPTVSSGVPMSGDVRPPAGPGVHRVTARRFLVDDLDVSVRTLADNLGLVATSVRRHEHGSLARYEFGHPSSAALELCQPSAESESGAFLRRWGAGPHAIVLEVGDLEHVADALVQRGVHARRGCTVDEVPALFPDPARTLGVPFELTEA